MPVYFLFAECCVIVPPVSVGITLSAYQSITLSAYQLSTIKSLKRNDTQLKKQHYKKDFTGGKSSK
jgi:hypothetical protein